MTAKEILVVSRRILEEGRAMKRLYNGTNGEGLALLAPLNTAHARKEVVG